MQNNGKTCSLKCCSTKLPCFQFAFFCVLLTGSSQTWTTQYSHSLWEGVWASWFPSFKRGSCADIWCRVFCKMKVIKQQESNCQVMCHKITETLPVYTVIIFKSFLLSVLSINKNSSMELAVIWGNSTCSDLACSDLAFSNLACSDLACSDLACSDLPCSDLAHSDLAHSDLACSDLAHFFCQNSYFFSLNIHNLATHLAHIQMEQNEPNGTFIHCFIIISTY